MTILRTILFLSLVGACTDAPDEQLDDEPVADDTVFYETVISLGPDGTPVESEPRAITAGEQRRQNELRLAIEAGELPKSAFPAIIQDAGCATDAWWLYSRTDWTGSRICFRGAGIAYLGAYYRFVTIGGVPQPIGDWRISAGSYWPGADYGSLRSPTLSDGGFGTSSSSLWSMAWPAWGTRTTFSHSVGADRVNLSY